MSKLFINTLFALAWAGMTGQFSLVNLAFGFVLGAAALAVIREQTHASTHFRRAGRAASLAAIFLYELLKSSLNVVRIVLSPSLRLSPAIIAYPLTVTSDAEITLLANMITLTPGTLSLDVSDDRRTLYVHAIDAVDPEAVITDIRQSFEVRIERLFAA